MLDSLDEEEIHKNSQLQNKKRAKEIKLEIGKAESINKICKQQGIRRLEEFSEDQRKVIVDECTKELLGPNVLSEKYNTIPLVIKHFVRYGNLR